MMHVGPIDRCKERKDISTVRQSTRKFGSLSFSHDRHLLMHRLRGEAERDATWPSSAVTAGTNRCPEGQLGIVGLGGKGDLFIETGSQSQMRSCNIKAGVDAIIHG